MPFSGRQKKTATPSNPSHRAVAPSPIPDHIKDAVLHSLSFKEGRSPVQVLDAVNQRYKGTSERMVEMTLLRLQDANRVLSETTDRGLLWKRK